MVLGLALLATCVAITSARPAPRQSVRRVGGSACIFLVGAFAFVATRGRARDARHPLSWMTDSNPRLSRPASRHALQPDDGQPRTTAPQRRDAPRRSARRHGRGGHDSEKQEPALEANASERGASNDGRHTEGCPRRRARRRAAIRRCSQSCRLRLPRDARRAGARPDRVRACSACSRAFYLPRCRAG